MNLLRAIASIILIATMVLGAPWLLLQLGQMPGFLPPWSQFPTVLLSPDNGRLLLVLVWAAAWMLWLWITTIVLTETVSALRGITPPTLPGGSWAQPAIRVLVMAAVGTLIAASTTTPSAAAPPTSPTPTAPPAAGAAASNDVPPTTAEPSVVIVEHGDSLWSLAEQHLDDPLRWPELYALNQGIEQPTGYALEDPDTIDIGWILKLPNPGGEEPQHHTASPTESPSETDAPANLVSAPRPEPPAPVTPPSSPPVSNTPAPGPSTPAVSPSAPAPASRAAAQFPDSGAVIQASATTTSPFPWQVAGLIGASSFLGAGMATLLASRRREQFRTRRPGRTIAVPDPQVAPIEKTAHLASGLSARLVNRLDNVLRRLHGTIQITTVIAARDGTITVTSDDDLPSPWVHEPDGWSLPNTTPVDQIGPQVSDAPCAYPLLVTIGTDTADRVVLINLETFGHATLSGDRVMCADFTRYLAAELAVNPWSAGVRVSCHGPAADAIAMAPDRLDADDTEILAIAHANQLRADRSGLTTPSGRSTQAEEETWGAGVILTPNVHIETADLIAAHPGRTGVALVTETADGATLTLTAAGRLTGLGMELTAVGLTEDEASGCAVLLSSTTLDDVPPQPADDLTDATGNILLQHQVDRLDNTAKPALLPQPDEDYLAATATTSDDLAVLAPRIRPDDAEQLELRDPTLNDDVKTWFSNTCPYPRLSLLGPVKARCYGKPPTKQKAYYAEALAYLALHPNGVTGDQFAEAFGLTVPRARTVISNLRHWVGTNPRTREPHIPDAKSSPEAQTRGVGLYLVQDLMVDADLFRRLRARALSKGPDGIDDLETALDLVQGRPFDQLRPAGWTWLFEGDRIDHHMTCAIGDVAHILVTHHLHVGDFEGARRAATTALQADPDSEITKLDLAAIMVGTGHSDMARQAVADALGPDSDLDVTPRGLEIINRHKWLNTS